MGAFRHPFSRTGCLATGSNGVRITIISETANRRYADLRLGNANCLLIQLFKAESILQLSQST
ncbi:hypothetical protein CGCF415_v010405 [Colletotrichum fructicola]|nr:hypothetical protein CGCFRS4_v011057 [Colletotrichum fructicola]KAF4899800.1 hypothetical protein CGCF415_v010405 [Colletotrichum fructicola]KAF4932453.1 hypothetical protein CGCF245_v010567 [Colletotrichum fructicola]